MPTVLMEQVSRWMEAQHQPKTRNAMAKNVTGKKEYVLQAIGGPCDGGWMVTVPERGDGRGVPLRLTKPYRNGDAFPIPIPEAKSPDTRSPMSSPVPL